MARRTPPTIALLVACIVAAELPAFERTLPSGREQTRLSAESLLTLVQRQTFRYFWDAADEHSGMALERIHVGRVSAAERNGAVATGGSGFGLMALLVGVERGFVSREAVVERLHRMVGFLERADRFHGAWPHWLNGETGEVIPFSVRDDGADIVETSYLAQGLLTVRQYLRSGHGREQRLAARIDRLWEGIEWSWFRRDAENVLYWHWSPGHGWAMNHPVRGYNECLITYVLAASSPHHAIPPEVYHEGWARDGKIVRTTKTTGLHLALKHNGAGERGGPLFWAHYSFLGLDPRGLKDRYADYWEHNRSHVLLNREYCVENPLGFRGYGEDCWGLTASYSIGFYAAHSPERDLGVISPTAALSSFPYAPGEALAALEHFYHDLGDTLWGPYGFFDAFSEEKRWTSDGYLAIDQGPIIVMIENHRTGLLWNLFMSCPEVRRGLERLGFTSPHLEK